MSKIRILNKARDRAKPKLLVVVGATLTAALILSACSGAPSGDPGESHLTVAAVGDPRSLMASTSTVAAETTMTTQVTERLLGFSTDSDEIVPALATEWEQTDELTLRLHLRENVKFSNGEDFNAESAAFSINEILLNSPPYATYVRSITGAEIVDEYTIDIKSSSPTGLLPIAMAVGSYQYPPAYFAEVGEEGFSTAPIGTGPFVLDKWVTGDHITYTANPDYWGGAPAVDRLTFKIIPDKQSQVAALQSGQVDIINDVPVGSIETIRNYDGVEFVSRPSSRIFMLFLNTIDEGPMTDPAVRRALWHAIDVESLIKNQLGGLGTELNSQVVSSSYFGFDSSMSTTKYDPEKAKSLLKAAGYPDGFDLHFDYPSGRYAQDAEIGQAISAQLAAVGIKVEQEALEPGTFFTKLDGFDMRGMALLGSLPAPDAHFMYQQFRTDGVYSYFHNAKLDALIEQEVTTPSQDERKVIFAEIAAMLKDNPPYVPLFQGEDTYAVSDRVSGYAPRADQLLDARTLSFK